MARQKQHKRDGAGQILIKEVQIPTASVLLLNTTPYVLIPAPGPKKFLMLLSGMVQLVRGTGVVEYGTDGDLTINYKTAGTGAAVTSSMDDVINDGALGSISIFGTVTEAENNAIADIENQPLALISTVNPTTGTMDLRVRLTYMVLPCNYL